jgi:hypothetical protein
MSRIITYIIAKIYWVRSYGLDLVVATHSKWNAIDKQSLNVPVSVSSSMQIHLTVLYIFINKY